MTLLREEENVETREVDTNIATEETVIYLQAWKRTMDPFTATSRTMGFINVYLYYTVKKDYFIISNNVLNFTASSPKFSCPSRKPNLYNTLYDDSMAACNSSQ